MYRVIIVEDDPMVASIITGTDWRRARGMRSLSSFGAALLLLLGGAAGNADAAPDEGSVKAFRRGLELQSEKPEAFITASISSIAIS